MALNAVESGAGIYYTGTYWNDYPTVQAAIHRRLSGNPDVGWMMHFFESVDRKPFRRALILNCGNGHVERDLIRLGIVEAAVGVDYAQDLLDEATQSAAEGGLPIEYVRMDTNTAAFPEGEYDLVINSAAGHHIAHIDRVMRSLATLLPRDGWFVSFDYVGPHRNQYPWEQWREADRVNELLPEDLRQTMNYPHLPTMLATDPTEAIHSELFLDVLDRYFDIRELRRLGGAIAYLLLTHNAAIAAADPSERDAAIDFVLEEDERYLEREPTSSLFVYAAVQPNKERLADEAACAEWEAEEVAREAAASRAGGHYYPLTLLQRIQLNASALDTRATQLAADVERLRGEVEALSREAAESRAEVARIRATFPVAQWDRVRNSWFRTLKERSALVDRSWRRLSKSLNRTGS